MHQQTQNHPPSKHSVRLHLFSPLPILPLTFYIFLSVASTQQPPQPKTTPLLEALKAEKSANKDKEAILRNHAHYKDQIPGAIARKDDKKKVPPAVQAQKVAEGAAAAAGNKKAGGKKQQVAPPAAASNQNKPGQVLPKPVGGNVPGPSNLGAKPPKPARAPRAPLPPPQANKQQNVVVPIQTAIPQQPGPSTPTQPPSDGATTPTPRRTRPVIGLASRQFEAALSGVAGGKSRREREREREREKEREEGAVTPTATAVSPSAPGLAQTPSIAAASTPTGNVVKEAGKPGPPTSPRRGRRGSHGGGGGSGGGGVGRPPSAASAAINDTKAPGIIQRADAPLIIQKDVPVVGPPVVSPVQMPMRGGRGGGGGLRRGRGGMRGRGGAPRGGFGSPTQGTVE